CTKPFVQIGERCFFFSSNKDPTYEYYKLPYKDRVFSVPVAMEWMNANFGCETIDKRARLMTVKSLTERQQIADYMRNDAHADIHLKFWCGGHLGRLSHPRDIDHNTLEDFYFHQDTKPIKHIPLAVMNTHNHLDDAFCAYLEFTGTDFVLGTYNCLKKLAFACE
ncbi:hypothetical protein KR018_005398, partial [Drosophila ironensis]